MKVGLARVQLQDSVVRIGRPSSVVANDEERGIAIDDESPIRKVLGGARESFFHRNDHVVCNYVINHVFESRTFHAVAVVANHG